MNICIGIKLVRLVVRRLCPRNFCVYPCQEADFLYWNGSCLPTCESPLTQQIQEGNIKFCLNIIITSPPSTDFPDQINFATRSNGEVHELTVIERTVNADKDSISIPWLDKEFPIHSTSAWGFFGLTAAEDYVLDNWDVNSNCGCFKQR